MASNERDDTQQNAAPETEDQQQEVNVPPGLNPEDLVICGGEKNPVDEAYARVGHADTTGISGLPANDEDAGVERRELYKKGATLVSRID